MCACKSEIITGKVIGTELIDVLGAGFRQNVEYEYQFKDEAYIGIQKRRGRADGDYLMIGDSVWISVNPYSPKQSELRNLKSREINESTSMGYHYKLDSRNNSITVMQGDSVIKIDSVPSH